jgi:predicted cupin superfamily sugar epimerase
MFYVDVPQKSDKRNFSTSIYFLLEGKQVSKFHRLKSDELWHFYDGTSVIIHIIDTEGKLTQIRLGRNVEDGEVFQAVIKSGNWFAAEVIDKKSFALVGCTVSPGFDFSDFEFGNREALIKMHPDLRELIQKFT